MKLKEIVGTETTVTVELTVREMEILYHVLDRSEHAYQKSGDAAIFTYREEEELWRCIANIRASVCNT